MVDLVFGDPLIIPESADGGERGACAASAAVHA